MNFKLNNKGFQNVIFLIEGSGVEKELNFERFLFGLKGKGAYVVYVTAF